MAGRPRRRAGLRPDDYGPIPEREKSLTEMSDEERRQYLRDMKRWLRDGEVRSGRRAPRTMREIAIFRERQQAREDRPGG